MSTTQTTTLPPQPYLDFKAAFPQVVTGHETLARTCHSAGPLDSATRNLVKLAIAGHRSA